MGDNSDSSQETIESLKEWTENLTVVIFVLGTCAFVVFFIRLLKLIQTIVNSMMSSPDKGRLRLKLRKRKKTRSGRSTSKSKKGKKMKESSSSKKKSKSRKKSKKISTSNSSSSKSSRKEGSSKKSERTKMKQSGDLQKVTVKSDPANNFEKSIVHPSTTATTASQETAKGFISQPITSATQASTVALSTTSALTKPTFNEESAKNEIDNQKRQEQLKAMDDIKLMKRVEAANL